MKIINRLPTVNEALAAQQKPLCESYWWFTGMDFNRPVIAKIGIGGHVHKGAFVWMTVGENCDPFGIRQEQLIGAQFELTGPIELPEDLRK